MSDALGNYSPADVTVVVALMHTVTGFVDGSFLTISKSTPTFTAKESADGIVTRTMSNSSMYQITLSLAQSSESNTVLSWMHNLDKVSKGSAMFPLLIKDRSGSSVMFAGEAWIESIPTSTFSTGIEAREWVISCATAASHVGDNYGGESGILEDVLSVGGGMLGSVL